MEVLKVVEDKLKSISFNKQDRACHSVVDYFLGCFRHSDSITKEDFLKVVSKYIDENR